LFLLDTYGKSLPLAPTCVFGTSVPTSVWPDPRFNEHFHETPSIIYFPFRRPVFSSPPFPSSNSGDIDFQVVPLFAYCSPAPVTVLFFPLSAVPRLTDSVVQSLFHPKSPLPLFNELIRHSASFLSATGTDQVENVVPRA